MPQVLRYLTSGESHGKLLTAVVDGMPSGLSISSESIDRQLARRQRGYGRGGRMAIETDTVEITSGIRHGKTLGSPVTLLVRNKDWENWTEIMSCDARPPSVRAEARVTRPRPGHADLTGLLKYDSTDIRNILERSSARETAARVAAGSVARALLCEFGIEIFSFVVEIGGVRCKLPLACDPKELFTRAELSEVRCPGKSASTRMKTAIRTAKEKGDSLGGLFEVIATGVPPGLGSHTQWDRKLDARLAMAAMSIQAIKSVEVGMGRLVASTPGSKVHDEIYYGDTGSRAAFWPLKKNYFRKTNNAGGIEGGMSNGEPIVIRAAMKPIPTLYKPLNSVDIETKETFKASVERSDACAVPAASVVAESAIAFELACAFLEKFGGDSITEIKRNYRGYLKQLQRR